MGIKAGNIIVGDTVVGSIEEIVEPTTTAPRKQYAAVRETSAPKTEDESNKGVSQYMLDMGAANKIDSLFD